MPPYENMYRGFVMVIVAWELAELIWIDELFLSSFVDRHPVLFAR